VLVWISITFYSWCTILKGWNTHLEGGWYYHCFFPLLMLQVRKGEVFHPTSWNISISTVMSYEKCLGGAYICCSLALLYFRLESLLYFPVKMKLSYEDVFGPVIWCT
jgi:hypothetical protein